MDDLLASIRKIITDDFGERSVVPHEGAIEPREAGRDRTADEDYITAQPEDPDALLQADVAASISAAFSAAAQDAPLAEPDLDDPAPPAADDGLEDAAAMAAIASAIAAERDARPAKAGWDPVVLSEPGLDTAAAGETQDDKANAAPRQSASSRIAALRATLEPRSGAKAGDSHGRDASARTTEPDPNPDNVYRLDPEQRTSPMSESAAADRPVSEASQTAPDTAGNIFRKSPNHRTEPTEDGLTSARTRQNVSMQLDQLSRTILNSNPRTLEDLVRDMVRPLLREWLEANLGEIVERQVRHEIDRVSARGR